MVASLIDKFGWKRKNIIHITALIGIFMGVLYASGGGYYWLDMVDHFISSYSLVLVGLLESLIVGWVYKASRLREHVNQTSNIKVGRWWEFMIKYFIPAILAITFVLSLKSDIVQRYGNYPMSGILIVGIGSVLLTFIIALIFYKLKWRRSGGIEN